MSRTTVIVLLVGMMAAVTGCDQNRRHTGAVAGTSLINGAIEAVLQEGSAGGVLYYIVGDRMERDDRIRLNDAFETGPSYETKTWTNPETGNRFSVIPEPAHEDPGRNMTCRKVRLMAEIEEGTEQTEALACRQNGRWLLQ